MRIVGGGLDIWRGLGCAYVCELDLGYYGGKCYLEIGPG